MVQGRHELTQNFGGTNKEYYGIFESGLSSMTCLLNQKAEEICGLCRWKAAMLKPPPEDKYRVDCYYNCFIEIITAHCHSSL